MKRPDRYDPDINDAFAELGQHYGIAIIPAPPAKPKGKAKVEAGVLIAQRGILARLRNSMFFSLAELNNAIAELVEELNNRRFQKLPGTRREAFDLLDRPRVKPLPRLRFELPQRKRTRANIDYHVEFDGRYYSVPFKLRQQPIEVRATPSVIECFHGGVRVASHRRSYAHPGVPVTNPEHRPREHADYGESQLSLVILGLMRGGGDEPAPPPAEEEEKRVIPSTRAIGEALDAFELVGSEVLERRPASCVVVPVTYKKFVRNEREPGSATEDARSARAAHGPCASTVLRCSEKKR